MLNYKSNRGSWTHSPELRHCIEGWHTSLPRGEGIVLKAGTPHCPEVKALLKASTLTASVCPPVPALLQIPASCYCAAGSKWQMAQRLGSKLPLWETQIGFPSCCRFFGVKKKQMKESLPLTKNKNNTNGFKKTVLK